MTTRSSEGGVYKRFFNYSITLCLHLTTTTFLLDGTNTVRPGSLEYTQLLTFNYHQQWNFSTLERRPLLQVRR